MGYRFGSREWVAAAHGVFSQRASCLATQGITERFSLCEVYRNTPPEFGWDGNELAWSCVCENGVADFQLRERDDVDFKIAGNFAALVDLARFEIRADAEREATYRKMAMAQVAAGEIEIQIGNGYNEPGNLESVHDVLARLGA